MELRHLRYFVAVAEELHFGRAAEQLYIAQSALSQQIRALEEELGVQLFDRTKRWVRLTQAGQAFLEDVREILQHVDRAVIRSQRVARGEVGQLRIGFTILALHSVLPQILKTFRDRFPKVQLILSEMATQNQVEALRSNQLDLGFLHPPIDEIALKLYALKVEPMIVVLPKSYPLAKHKQLDMRSLNEFPLIIHPRHEGADLYDRILQLYQSVNRQPEIVQEVTTSPARIGLVAAGLGITFVPKIFSNFNYEGVIYRELQETAPELVYAVAWRQEQRSAVLQAFLEVIVR